MNGPRCALPAILDGLLAQLEAVYHFDEGACAEMKIALDDFRSALAKTGRTSAALLYAARTLRLAADGCLRMERNVSSSSPAP